MKRPAFQFYPGDWLRDAGLRSCSVGARGLWIDMLCHMHDGKEYGYLRVGDKIITLEVLARMVGESAQDVSVWLSELAQAGVYSVRESDGCIYSRRMLKDEELRNIRAANGSLGGSPLLKNKDNHEQKDKKTTVVKRNPTPSSSPSSASADEKDTPLPPGGDGVSGISFADFWKAYPKKADKGRAQKAWTKLSSHEQAEAIKALPVHCRSEQWLRDVIPHASTWLNGKRWLDEVKVGYVQAAKPAVKKEPEPPPPWMDGMRRILEIRKAKGDILSTIDKMQIVAVLRAFPKDAWSFLRPEEYNFFSPILKEANDDAAARATLAATPPSPPTVRTHPSPPSPGTGPHPATSPEH